MNTKYDPEAAFNEEMSKTDLSLNLDQKKAQDERAIAWKILSGGTNFIKMMVEENTSSFSEVEVAHTKFGKVFAELKEAEDLRLAELEKEKQREAVQTASAALEGLGMDKETLLSLLAEQMGVKVDVKSKKPTRRESTRKPADQYVIKFLDQSGEVNYVERVTGGQRKGALAEHLSDTGKNIKDLVIGRLVADKDGYTNENSNHEVIDSEALKTYLKSIGAEDKFIEAGVQEPESKK